MKIFYYDKRTKEYIGFTNAQPHPFKSGEFIFPPNSTRISPPELKQNETTIFVDNCWNVIPDFRGLEQINLDTKEVSIIEKFGNLEKGYMLYSNYLLSDEYKKYLSDKEKEYKYNEILFKIKNLDKKRIRAFCEPSVKDESTGQTWLEFYNEQIKELRKSLEEI